MPFHPIIVGLAMLFCLGWQASPPMDKGSTGVVFGDLEVSTMLTANKVVPATFFTNCVRSQLNVVLNSQSTIDWMMTTGAASPACTDSVNVWTMTALQRQTWNVTSPLVKTSFLNSFTAYRSYAVQHPTATCFVSGLTPSSPTPYTSVSGAPDSMNPERFLITLKQQPGGSQNGQE